LRREPVSFGTIRRAAVASLRTRALGSKGAKLPRIDADAFRNYEPVALELSAALTSAARRRVFSQAYVFNIVFLGIIPPDYLFDPDGTA